MDERCPKCGAERTNDACPKCGLVFAKYDGPAEFSAAPQLLQDLWRQLEENWGQSATHALFVEQSIALGRSDYAAARYRQKGDDAKAREYLQKLAYKLEQELKYSASPRRDVKRRRLIGLFVLALLLACISLIALLFAYPTR